MILIISNRQDLTSDFVVRELTRRGLPFARFNTDEFPTLSRGKVQFGFDKPLPAIFHWNNRTKVLNLSEVKSVLYRRPTPPVPDKRITESTVRKFCIDECQDFLRGLWFSMNCHWISHPEAIRKAEHKIYQLAIAQKLPFVIPKTLVTNDPNEVKKFFYECTDGIVVKPLYIGFIRDSEGPKNIYTSVVSENDLNDLNSVVLAPSIFQEKVLKRFDIRVTVVGETVFAAKIHPDSLPPNIPDWRFAPLADLQHEKYSLPLKVKEACLDLVKMLGLDFGAIDLALDEEGNHVFFEINANGQWAWLETTLGLPISNAIVERLSAGKPKDQSTREITTHQE